MSALLSGKKNDKSEYLVGEEILQSDQSRMIKQGKFTYSSLRKAFDQQTKKLKSKEKAL